MGGGWGGLHCLSFFRYSFKFGDKASAVRFAVQVLLNFEGKTALSITGDAGIVALLIWIKRISRNQSHLPIQCRGEMLGNGETVVSFF